MAQTEMCPDPMNQPHSDPNVCEIILVAVGYFIVFIFFPISWIFCVRITNEFERGVVFRLGRIDRKHPTRGPGLFFILPCVDTLEIVDLRIRTYDIPPQEVLTKDSVTVAVDAIINYFVNEPLKFVINVEHTEQSIHLMSQTAMRNNIGKRDLSEVLEQKESIGECIKENLKIFCRNWGLLVTQVELKDIKLPVAMQRAMAAEAEATREAKAKIVAAEGEQKSALALCLAADAMSKSPYSLHLRYLQTLNSISAENNSTVIFPLPIELLRYFNHK